MIAFSPVLETCSHLRFRIVIFLLRLSTFFGRLCSSSRSRCSVHTSFLISCRSTIRITDMYGLELDFFLILEFFAVRAAFLFLPRQYSRFSDANHDHFFFPPPRRAHQVRHPCSFFSHSFHTMFPFRLISAALAFWLPGSFTEQAICYHLPITFFYQVTLLSPRDITTHFVVSSPPTLSAIFLCAPLFDSLSS